MTPKEQMELITDDHRRRKESIEQIHNTKNIEELKNVLDSLYPHICISGNRIKVLEVISRLDFSESEKKDVLMHSLKKTKQNPQKDLLPYLEKGGKGFPPAIRYYNKLNRYDVIYWLEVELGIDGKGKKQDEIKFPQPIIILAKNSDEIIDLLYEELTNAQCIKNEKTKFLEHFSSDVTEFEKIAWLETQSYLPYLFKQLEGERGNRTIKEQIEREKNRQTGEQIGKQIILSPNIYITLYAHFVKKDGSEFARNDLSSHYAKLKNYSKGEKGAKKLIDPIVQRICDLVQ